MWITNLKKYKIQKLDWQHLQAACMQSLSYYTAQKLHTCKYNSYKCAIRQNTHTCIAFACKPLHVIASKFKRDLHLYAILQNHTKRSNCDTSTLINTVNVNSLQETLLYEYSSTEWEEVDTLIIPSGSNITIHYTRFNSHLKSIILCWSRSVELQQGIRCVQMKHLWIVNITISCFHII